MNRQTKNYFGSKMPDKNLDGIKKIAKPRPLNRGALPGKILKMDGIVKRPPRLALKVKSALSKLLYNVRFYRGAVRPKPVYPDFVKKLYLPKRVPVMVSAVAVLVAFSGGIWAALSTPKINAVADTDSPKQANYQVLLPDAHLPPQNTTSLSNNVLFNTPIEYLQNYLASVAEPDIIAQRRGALANYLTEKKSPLAEAAETIAQQPHWQLILAIAFAESTLGKNCADNNCSNIGVGPGHPSWRKYSSYQAWVVDFNRLLDKKYKDQTLRQMCGVYVKPCNPNWLLATQQVLTELKDRGIE